MNDLYNNSDRDIRDMVQGHEFDFVESAWEDMEEVLDTRNGTLGGRPLFYSILVIGLILFGLAILNPSTARQIINWNFDSIENLLKEEVSPIEEEPTQNNTPQAFHQNTTNTKSLSKLVEVKVGSELTTSSSKLILPTLEKINTIKNIPTQTLADLGIQNKSLDVKKKAPKKTTIEVYAGTAVSPNINVAPVFGLTATLPLSEKLNLQMGLEGKLLTQSKISLERTSIKHHSFAVAAPVNLKYDLNQKHSITSGIKPQFVTNSGQSPSINVGVTVGYERRINERLAMDIKYNKQIIKSEGFDPDSGDNVDIALSLRYKF